MRTLLVVNPFATSTTPDLIGKIVEILEQKLDLTVRETRGPNDASEFARKAQAEGFELVLSFGGDGTLNEIANGILQAPNVEKGPIVAAIPGGNANVFIRNIGWPTSALAACEQILKSVTDKSIKTIGVGRATTENLSRYFLFNCGIGLDAAVLARMQDRRATGKKVTDFAYTRLAIREFLVQASSKEPNLEIFDPNGISHGKAHLALIINLAPWTYLGELPLPLTPEATLDTALDVFAAKELSIGGISRLIRRAVRTRSSNLDNSFITLNDQESASFIGSEDLWVQVDGEVLAPAKRLDVQHFPQALEILI